MLWTKGFFEIDESMMKADLFVFGCGFASLPLMLNQVVDVEGLLDSKTFMDHRINCVRFASRKGVTHCSREGWISFARKDMKGNTR